MVRARLNAGRNRIEAIRLKQETENLVYDFDNGLNQQNALPKIGFLPELGLGDDESLSASGDSGGPVFLDGAIAAITSYGDRLPAADVNDEFDSSWGELECDVRVSGMREFVAAATRGTARFVGLKGDFNENGDWDTADLEILALSIREGVERPDWQVAVYDLNHDGTVSEHDQRAWVKDIMKAFFGDANLDGEFSSTHLVDVFVAGEYEDAIECNSSWASGDWDANGDFTSSDLVLTFQDGGYENGPRPVRAAVPEPSGLVLLVIGLCGFGSITALFGCACFPALSVVRGWSMPNSFVPFV